MRSPGTMRALVCRRCAARHLPPEAARHGSTPGRAGRHQPMWYTRHEPGTALLIPKTLRFPARRQCANRAQGAARPKANAALGPVAEIVAHTDQRTRPRARQGGVRRRVRQGGRVAQRGKLEPGADLTVAGCPGHRDAFVELPAALVADAGFPGFPGDAASPEGHCAGSVTARNTRLDSAARTPLH